MTWSSCKTCSMRRYNSSQQISWIFESNNVNLVLVQKTHLYLCFHCDFLCWLMQTIKSQLQKFANESNRSSKTLQSHRKCKVWLILWRLRVKNPFPFSPQHLVINRFWDIWYSCTVQKPLVVSENKVSSLIGLFSKFWHQLIKTNKISMAYGSRNQLV